MAAASTSRRQRTPSRLPRSFSGPGGLTKLGAGTLRLASANGYSGATMVLAGTLRGGIVNAFSSNSATTLATGATLDLGGFNQTIGSLAGAGTVSNSGAAAAVLTAGGDNSSTVFSGAIQDDGPTGLTKTGTGTLTLSGTSTYSGATTVAGGTLGVDGSIVNSAVTVQKVGRLPATA